MNTQKRIATHYDQFLHGGYVSAATNPELYPLFPVMELVLEKYSSKQRGKSVLDLGCGPGLLKEIADYERYIGVDISDSMLQAAASHGYYELVQASLLDFLHLAEDDSYDSVICFSVAYFLNEEEIERLITEIKRVAKKFWLVTLDAIPEDLVQYYKEKEDIPLYNHCTLPIEGATERFTVDGWKSVVDGKKFPMEIVIGLK